MANKEKIDYLLLDIKELETLIAGMRDAEVYPVSFFSQTFNLTHKGKGYRPTGAGPSAGNSQRGSSYPGTGRRCTARTGTPYRTGRT